MRIALISCVSKKLDLGPGENVPAKDLYISPLFRKAWAYAEEVIRPDRIYILSAEHHLLNPETRIGAYNKTLNGMSASQIKDWAKVVLAQLRNEGISLNSDLFYILAGRNYHKYLVGKDAIQNPRFVYEGCTGIGHILHFLDSHS